MSARTGRIFAVLSRGLAILVLGLAFAAAPVWAQDALLDAARARLAAGDAAGAYALLLPAEEQRVGDPAFDYLLGIAALDAGQATEAVFALERVVAVQPDNALARAELARAYATLREFESARRELRTVREGSVPSDAQAQVERYLGAVESAISRASTQIRGYLGVRVGYDSNVNAATSDTALALPAFGGAIFQLNRNAVGSSDQFAGILAGAAVRHELRPDLAINAGFDVNNRLIDDRDEFDTHSFAGYLGMDYRRNDYTYSLAAQGEHFRLDSDAYRNAVGVIGQVRRPVDAVSQVTGYLQATRLSYPSQSVRDANRYTVGAAYSRALQGEYSPVVYVGAYGGIEDEISSGVPHLGHDFVGARAGIGFDATHDLRVSASVSIEYRSYGGRDPLFLVGREDMRYSLRLAADYQPVTHWTLTPAVELANNDSNVAINDFDRGVVSVTLRRDFR
jgi:tetratricopeptide (TPR) repeat protein